jgi:hypothetical protein
MPICSALRDRTRPGFACRIASASLRQYAGERGQEGTIGRPQRGALLLPSEHGELMPQHKQLDVFGDLAVTTQQR